MEVIITELWFIQLVKTKVFLVAAPHFLQWSKQNLRLNILQQS